MHLQFDDTVSLLLLLSKMNLLLLTLLLFFETYFLKWKQDFMVRLF